MAGVVVNHEQRKAGPKYRPGGKTRVDKLTHHFVALDYSSKVFCPISVTVAACV